jgi:hypothetical protein
MKEESLSQQIPALDLRFARTVGFPVARTASLLSLELPGLPFCCSYRFSSPQGARVGAMDCFLLFSA